MARRVASRSPTPKGNGTGRRPRILVPDNGPPTVLLVDDSDDCRLLYTEYLTRRGIRVEHAVDGEHALFKVAVLQPHVVVMDLSLPTLDGWAATERLKSHPKTRHIPIVVLTGIVQREPLERARRAGADHIESKPCAPDMLLSLVERYLPTAP